MARKTFPSAQTPKRNAVGLEAYWRLRYPGYQLTAHIRLLIRFLESLKPNDLAIINMPPRHSKTETVKAYVEWRLGRDPTLEAMYTSYTASLANKASRAIRNEVQTGRAFRRCFPDVHLASDARNVQQWNLEQGGGLRAVGVGGSVTGMGGGLIVSDDPIKGRKQAESKQIRDTTATWLKADLLTRATPDCVVILIQTRWHVEDPTGVILEESKTEESEFGAFRVRVLNLPAIAEGPDALNRQPGVALWPDRWPVEKLEKNRKILGEYDWASLYQQRPLVRGGSIFKDTPARFDLEHHNRVKEPGWRVTLILDLAASTKRTADYTVFQAMAHKGYGENRKARVLEVRRGQWPIDRIAAEALELQRIYGAVIAVEQVAAQIAVVDYLASRGLRLKRINPSKLGDKFARNSPAAAAWNADRIEVPYAAHWDVAGYVAEHAAFTGTAGDVHDDQVDTTGYGWLEGEQATPVAATAAATGRAATAR